jgi:hypothetical protein
MNGLLLGSGGWIPTTKRETCFAFIREGSHFLLIDAGTGVGLATRGAGARLPASYAGRYPERAAPARRLGEMRAALAGRDGNRRIDGGPRLTPFPL